MEWISDIVGDFGAAEWIAIAAAIVATLIGVFQIIRSRIPKPEPIIQVTSSDRENWFARGLGWTLATARIVYDRPCVVESVRILEPPGGRLLLLRDTSPHEDGAGNTQYLPDEGAAGLEIHPKHFIPATGADNPHLTYPGAPAGSARAFSFFASAIKKHDDISKSSQTIVVKLTVRLMEAKPRTIQRTVTIIRT